MRSFVFLMVGVLLPALSLAAEAITAVGPGRQPARLAAKTLAGPAFVAPDVSASVTIDLGAPADALVDAMGKVGSAPGKGGAGKGAPVQIGFGRTVGRPGQLVDGAALTWRVTADGRRAARIEVVSGGAAAVRLRISASSAPEGVELRFSGTGGKQVFGPVDLAEVVRAPGFWTPVLEGERGVLEIFAPGAEAAAAVRLAIPQVSHLTVAGAGLRRFRGKRETEIGDAQACEIDVACVANPSQALYDAASSVAKMVYTEYGATFLCTGTVVNDSVTSFRPLFYTAHHCVRTQEVADTLNTYWFFDARACASLAVPDYVLLGGGAWLLAASNDFDWALLELRRAPPVSVVYSAWRAEPIPVGAIVSTLHHAGGDLKKFSQGLARGYSIEETYHLDGTRSGGGTFIDAQWTQGSTELGSSGAGLFTFLAPGSYYELRGGLFGGEASCFNTAGLDYFSRMDAALPLLKEYLTPDVGYPAGVVPVVEFYNRNLDHFFVTADPNEIRILDEGTQIRGWRRTGFRFLAYSTPAAAPPDATPVCRFYLRPEVGDSHFYSASPAECAEVERRFGHDWIYESPNVFYIRLPDLSTGQCPAGTSPIYRFYDPWTINHRFTAETSLRDDMVDFGLIQEGYGNPPAQVAMCAPAG